MYLIVVLAFCGLSVLSVITVEPELSLFFVQAINEAHVVAATMLTRLVLITLRE